MLNQKKNVNEIMKNVKFKKKIECIKNSSALMNLQDKNINDQQVHFYIKESNISLFIRSSFPEELTCLKYPLLLKLQKLDEQYINVYIAVLYNCVYFHCHNIFYTFYNKLH